ncbi:MAG: hypothetical protein WCV86_05395 [Patescibacteria group bacterium]|jgi:hypothetical protein
MSKARTPTPVKKNPRDPEGRKELQLKSFWKKNCLPDESLKAYARRAVNFDDGDDRFEGKAAAQRWLFNKRANASNPPLEIGNTRKKKSSQGGGKK